MDPVKNSIPVDSIIHGEFRYINFKSLNGWNGKPQACLRSNGIVEIARDFRNRSQIIQIVLMITLIVTLALVSFILLRIINRPLRNLISSLMAEDPEPIRGLLRQKSEFGHLAQLMSDFFIQKKKLVEEIEGRIKIEKELTLAKDRAEESDRLKSAFLNNISHEIRTPMNAIIGFSDLIQDPRITDQERIEFTGIISDSSYRLLGIITDLINISTIESGQVDISKEQINLNSLLQGIFTQIKREIDTTQVALNLHVVLKDDLSVILSDQIKLNQIILNLLNNSVKFTKSGKIEFGYNIRNAEIEFFVSDTGIGISSEKFENIFARFQQADDSISRQFGGTGLGLPISKAYVELLGGRMWLKSEVGTGTQFYFTIPYKPA
jgi:signal transduction histidine kinase